MQMLKAVSSALEKFFSWAAMECVLHKTQGVNSPACGSKRAVNPLRSREKWVDEATVAIKWDIAISALVCLFLRRLLCQVLWPQELRLHRPNAGDHMAWDFVLNPPFSMLSWSRMGPWTFCYNTHLCFLALLLVDIFKEFCICQSFITSYTHILIKYT